MVSKFTIIFSNCRMQIKHNQFLQNITLKTLNQLQITKRAAHSHRTSYSMDKVYLRNAANTEDLHISFRYVNETLRIDRDFNFCRKMNELVDIAINRIRGNIEKELVKKSKKTKRKTPAEVPESITKQLGCELTVGFVRSSSDDPITEVSFADMLQLTKSDLKLKIMNRVFDVAYNQPWVINLVLPTSILAGFTVYPSKVDLQFADKKHSKGQWFKAKMPPSGDLEKAAKWELCGEGFLYNTTNSDIDYILKFVLTPGNGKGEIGPPVENIAKNAVQAGPGQCPFEMRHNFTKEKLSEDKFRFVSYNLLADLYADSDYSRKELFPYCPAYALKMEYRKQLFMKELIGYNADVICLQEVDMKIFDFDLKPVFEAPDFNYCGVIAQKGTCGEGVATFYRQERLELLKTYELNIGDNIQTLDVFKQLWQRISANKKLVERICDRSTTLQLSLLRCRKTERLILVANTHLYFHPDADHIRLLQFGFSMLYVEHIYKTILKEYCVVDERKLGIIFCGDFNSVPECGIYKLMTERFVDSDFVDWSSNKEEAVKGVSLTQPFSVASACGTPDYTNYTHLFAACLDYIFYQNDRFDVIQVVPLPSTKELQEYTAIPSVVFPSDHVALVADLKFIQC